MSGALVASGVLGCTNKAEQDLLLFPAIVAIDSLNNRVFVIDNQLNGLNLVDPSNNSVLEVDKDRGLLTSENPQLLPSFPNSGAVVPMAGGVSRIFVIGGNSGPLNQITVLDYVGGDKIQSAPISPIAVPGSSTDTLSGIAVDLVQGQVYVSNATTGLVYIFDINTGLENADSPVPISGIPGRLSYDPVTALLAVSNGGNDTVSFIDTLDLAGPIITLDVGLSTRDVGLVSNAAGTVLFLSGSQQNTAQVYQLNLADLSTSTMLFQITAPLPTVPLPNPNFLTGTLNQVKAGNLSNGQMAGFFTQSSGDLLVLELTQDLNTLTPTLVSVGAVSGEGIDVLLNSSGQATTVYYASPGVGALTVVDPLSNVFEDQIN